MLWRAKRMLVVKEFDKKYYIVNRKSGKRKNKKGYEDMKKALEALAEMKDDV